MRRTEYRGSSSVVAMAIRGRSIPGLRRNEVVSVEHGQEQELKHLDLFQTHVADRLHSLLSSSSSDQSDHGILSLPFLQKLIDAVLSWEQEFKTLHLLILARNPEIIRKTPIERLLSDLLDRTVKSLDIISAVTDSVHALQHWNRHADIAASAVIPNRHRPIPIGMGQLSSAKKALEKLLLASSPPDPHHHHHHHCGGGGEERAWSFDRNLGNREGQTSRSLLGSARRGWSAARQVQSMAANLAAPRGGDAGSAALGLAVYTMSSVLVFAMWALAAAFPFQERNGPVSAPLAPPRQLEWAAAMVGLQERIVEDWRRKGRKGAGLLAEMQEVERCGRELMEAVTATSAAVGGMEVEKSAGELADASSRLEEGLGPLEKQVREVFRRVVRSRADVVRPLHQ